MNDALKSEPRLAGRGIADETAEGGSILAPETAADKALATARAALARSGLALYELSAGTFLVTGGGVNREVPSLAALFDFARQVGAV